MALAFSEHYNRLWKDAIKIKVGNDIYWDRLIGFGERLLAQAERQNDAHALRRLPKLINKLKDLHDSNVKV